MIPPLQLKKTSRARKEEEIEAEETVEEGGGILAEEWRSEKKKVFEKATSDVSDHEPTTFDGKIEGNQSDDLVEEDSDRINNNNPVLIQDGKVGWPALPSGPSIAHWALPGSFYQNLDSPFLGRDEKMSSSIDSALPPNLRKNRPVSPFLDSVSKNPQTSLQRGNDTSQTEKNEGEKKKWREGEEGKEDLRRRRKLVARLRKLRQKSEEVGGRGRDGEDEEKAIWSLEAEEGGISLYKRIMDYTSQDFSARTDSTTAIVNAASRHLD